ncbi:hypothetical protein DEU56DRAFT_912055 [Suillus clintonianus]|uniref:uncharacterized protein n=1 Tax=Suillus clintonianus TaxID=1904413 RepID=UPI001B87912A|nr:uncharacterized protein DEU56DRAFT_912055 [Suillus clintonianus]KAG2139788.1 hypothetical protein DEU56DRAFT_912055 [Suillus clintonianus]
MSAHHVTRTKNATQYPGLPDVVLKNKHRKTAKVAAEHQFKLDIKEEKESNKDMFIDATPRAAALPKPKPHPRPILKKIHVKPTPLPVEDNMFISDVEMDDTVADTSTFNPDPSQASETTDSHADDSELKSSVQVIDTTPQPARAKRSALPADSLNDDVMVTNLPIWNVPKKAPSRKSAPPAQVNHSDDKPMDTTDLPDKPQWAMLVLSNENTPQAQPRDNQTEESASRKEMPMGMPNDKGKGKDEQQCDKKPLQLKSDSTSTTDIKEFSTGINDWAASIPKNTKPGSKANTSRPSIFKNSSTSHHSGSVLPPLTNGSTQSSSNSVLTNNILISHAAPVIHINEEPKKNHRLEIIDGGLSDEDETHGLEHEAVITSPPKGSPVYQTEPVKKPSNDDLPKGINQTIWHRVFIPTYIQYVTTLANPWKVPTKLVCEKMQVIWDVVFPNITHTVTSLSSVYYIAVQRITDSYHSHIGSAAIVIVIAYLKSQDSLRDSNDNRAEFAEYALSNLWFLYKKANGNDKSKLWGLYQGVFIVQTFGAHFTTTRGTRKIPGVDKPGVLANPAEGLALSCATVKQALALWSTRTLTFKMVQAVKNKTSISLPKTMNQSTGKDKFEVIIASAMEFSKMSCRPGDDIDDAAMEDDLSG